MTDEKQKQPTRHLHTILMTLTTLGVTSGVVQLFKLRDDVADLKFREELRNAKVQTIDNNVQLIVNDFRLIKDSDLRDIKDRLKTLEIKSEK